METTIGAVQSGMLNRMERSSYKHTPFDGSGWGDRSHDEFDTTLIKTESTPLSLGLLNHKSANYRTLLL